MMVRYGLDVLEAVNVTAGGLASGKKTLWGEGGARGVVRVPGTTPAAARDALT